jgi:hypothetical protein
LPELGDIMSSGRLSLRSNFATQHLKVAIRDARNAHVVEQANDIAQFGPWFDDMMMYVPVAVVMAAAALEANSTEIIQDLVDELTRVQPASVLLKGLKDLSDDRSGHAMGKYAKLAGLLNKMPNVSSPAWHDAELLFRLRNSFMHFKPAWDDQADVHDSKLVKELKARVPVTPAYQSNFMFPYGFLTYGCAKWAVGSATTFSAEFSALIGVGDRFAGGSNLP